MNAKQVLRMCESFGAHCAALVVGAIMTLVGIGMGITVTLIPIGLPLGLIGAGIFTWGVCGFGGSRRHRRKNGA